MYFFCTCINARSVIGHINAIVTMCFSVSQCSFTSAKKPPKPCKIQKKKQTQKNPNKQKQNKTKNQDKNQKKLFIQNAIEKWKEYSFEQIWINVYIET